jgi:hypothetical protein
MTAIRHALLTLALAGATFAACDRHANAACPQAGPAEATLVDVQARLWELQLDPPSREPQRRALVAVLRAAKEQLRSARAICSPAMPPAMANPFEEDPFDASTSEPMTDPEWCLVMGCATTADSVLGIGGGER